MNRTKLTLLIFLLALILFAVTLSLSLGPGDAASWAVNSLLAGLPPAPGNLLYLLACFSLSKIFNALLVPLLGWAAHIEPATGVNLVSALSSAATAAISFALIDRLITRLGVAEKDKSLTSVRWIIGAGAVFAATLPSIWASAVTAGPESFNLLILTFSLWLIVRVEEGCASPGLMMLLWAYLMGLSFSQQHVFLFSAAILLPFLILGTEVKKILKSKWFSMLGFFILGSSIYLYISIRPVLDAGLGGQVGLFKKDFWSYAFNFDALRNSLPRNANFFMYQVPLFWTYLKSQAGHWISGTVILAVFLYALVRFWQHERKLCLTALAFLLFTVLATLWLVNPKLGLEQAWDKFPDPIRHDPMHLDRLFLFTFLLSGFWVVLGLIFLRMDLVLLFGRFARKMEFQTSRFVRLTGGTLTVVLVILQLSFIYFRWQSEDMSGYYAVRDLAENQLKGLEPDCILILRNNEEYYPAVYVNKFVSKGSERSLINYFSLSDKSYLKRIKKSSPPVAMTFDDSYIDRLYPIRLPQKQSFQFGDLEVVYPNNTQFLVRDIAIIDILRANGFTRPVYFSHKLGVENMVGLNRYLVLQGLAVRLLEKDTLATADSLNFWRREPGAIAVDMNKCSKLLWDEYKYNSTAKDLQALRQDRLAPLLSYARIHLQLGEAYLGRKDENAANWNFRQLVFFDPQYENMLFNFATRFASTGHYDKAKEYATNYFKKFPPDPLKWAGLAKIALEKTDTIPATEMLLESIKVDPYFQLGFQKLIRLYDAMGKKVMASAFLSQWVGRNPKDEETRRLWEEYMTTKTLPPDFPD
ncbi:MAG TPA: DUF2723 domain-containing protein [archaeon]|nr:DUF2723 domain-containing protein [archaeon]